MLKFYRCYGKTFYKGKLYGIQGSTTVVAEEKEIKNHTMNITWDNLSEVYSEYARYLPFNIWYFKRGRIISWFDATFISLIKGEYRDIKERKTPDLDITLEICYREFKPSLQEVLSWHDAEQASRYLKENNLMNFTENA